MGMMVRSRNALFMGISANYRWSKTELLEVLYTYFKEVGHFPLDSVMKHGHTGLPSLGNYYKYFGMGYMQVIREYFPEEYKSHLEVVEDITLKERIQKKEDYIKVFKEQFEKHGFPECRDYDSVRDEGTPSIKVIGVSTGIYYQKLVQLYFPEVWKEKKRKEYQRKNKAAKRRIEKFMQIFLTQYEKHGYPSFSSYDTVKDENTPGIYYIKVITGMTYMELKYCYYYLKENQTLNRKEITGGSLTAREYILLFTWQYRKHNCRYADDYDQLRDKNTPSLRHIQKKTGLPYYKLVLWSQYPGYIHLYGKQNPPFSGSLEADFTDRQTVMAVVSQIQKIEKGAGCFTAI